jgi:predicted dehydrogenase
VLIATPPPSHAALVAEAAAAGMAILLEKPIAYSLAEAEAAALAVERAGVPCMVAYQRRYDDDCLKVRELLEEGAIGEVRAALSLCRLVFASVFRAYASTDKRRADLPGQDLPPDWLAENSIHHLNLLRFWLGEVRHLHGAVYRGPGHDLGQVTLEFERGVLVSHHQLRGMGCGEEITLYGSKGNLTIELAYPHRPWRAPRLTLFTIDPPGWREIALARTSPYTNQLAHFVEFARGAAPNRSDLRDSLRDLVLCKAIVDAAVHIEPPAQLPSRQAPARGRE